jgi:hypothetical protein
MLAHQIATRAIGGTVSITIIRDPADGSARYAVSYESRGGRWLSRHRFQDITQAEAGGLSSYDLTMSNGFIIRAEGNYGAVFYADGQTGASKPIFDMTGCNSSKIQGVTFYAMDQGGNPPAVLPSCAVLLASSSAGGDCNRNEIFGGGMAGFFSSCCLGMVAATDNKITFVSMVQQATQQHGLPYCSPALVHSTRPDWYLSSPYTPIIAGPANCGENTFDQVEIHGRNMQAGGWNAYFRDAYSVRFIGGNSSCEGGGTAHKLFQGNNNRSILISGMQYWAEDIGRGVVDPQHLIQADTATRLIMSACDENGAYSGSRLAGSFPGFVWQ